MGTTASVQVKANDTVGYFFRGSDGYPTGLGVELAHFCLHAKKFYNFKHILHKDFAIMFDEYMEDIVKGSNLVEDESPESDANYIYGVDFDTNRFIVSVNGEMVFNGTIEDWADNAKRLTFGITRLFFEDKSTFQQTDKMTNNRPY